MNAKISRIWQPLVVIALLLAVLLAGCTTTPQGTPPATTEATTMQTTAPPTPPPTTQAPVTTAPPTTVATTPVVMTTAAPVTTAIPATSGITIQEYTFKPASITVPAGTNVTWTNLDSAPHQVVSDMTTTQSLGALFMSGTLQQGQKYSFTFRNPGTYAYHCGLHSFMTGTVTVT